MCLHVYYRLHDQAVLGATCGPATAWLANAVMYEGFPRHFSPAGDLNGVTAALFIPMLAEIRPVVTSRTSPVAARPRYWHSSGIRWTFSERVVRLEPGETKNDEGRTIS